MVRMGRRECLGNARLGYSLNNNNTLWFASPRVKQNVETFKNLIQQGQG
jgi:hypothetical protein